MPAAAPEAADEFEKRVGQVAIFLCQRRNFFRPRDGFASDQHQMAAHIEIRMLARARHRVFESRSVGHQRGAGQNAFAKRAHDSFIHTGRESEVICVDDQSFHYVREVASARKSYHGRHSPREKRGHRETLRPKLYRAAATLVI
jgi:hypothetical protein